MKELDYSNSWRDIQNQFKLLTITALFCAFLTPSPLMAHGNGHDDDNNFVPMKMYDHKSNMPLDPLTGALINNHPKNNPSLYAQGTDGGHNWRATERSVRIRSATGALRETGEGGEQGDNLTTGYIDGDWLFIRAVGESRPPATTNAALSTNPLADDEELLAKKTPIESIQMGAVYIYKRDGNKWVFQQKLNGSEAKYVDPVLPITNNNNIGPFLANKNQGVGHRWGMAVSVAFFVQPDGGLSFDVRRGTRGPSLITREGDNLFVTVGGVYSQPSAFTDGTNTIPTGFGTVLVYKLKGKKNSERWEFSQMLLEPKVSNYDGGDFGYVVAKGKWAIISAQRADRASGPLKSFDPQHPLLAPDDTGVEGEDVGAVSLWKEDHNGIWRVVQKSISSPRGDLRLNAFGNHIEFDGQKALISEQAGDYAEGLSAWNGKIHEFKLTGNNLVYTGNTLTQLDEPNSIVLNPNYSFSWGFYNDFDTDGDYIAVGANGAGFIGDFKGLPGYVMIYKRQGNQIKYLETIRATDDMGSRAHLFGASIEMKDGYLFVGDPDRDNVAGGNTREGRVYVYKRMGNHYVEVNQLQHPNNIPYQGFGVGLNVNKALKKGDIEMAVGSSSPGGHVGIERSDALRRTQPGSVTVLKMDDDDGHHGHGNGHGHH